MRTISTTGSEERDSVAAQDQISKDHGGNCRGKIFVIGIGPGSADDMSPRAAAAIAAASVVVGYDTYIEFVKHLLEDREVISTGMLREIDRCQAAVDKALSGKTVAVISSGDSGIYGMAGLVLELAGKLPAADRPEVEVIPGISAVSAAAAILGAPLMHDFAVISLSDLMTPWEVIRKRVEAVAAADFVISLYNPKSNRRTRQIEEVREIVLAYRSAATPVGIVRQATRSGQTAEIATLQNFTEKFIDMFSLVIIGNSRTYTAAGRMITPRGYAL